MTPAIRRARPGEGDAIAAMVRALARDIGADHVPRATGADIERLAFAPAPRLLLWVAEAEDRLVGTLVGAPTFSTWRGQEGLYVVDLYVEAGLRGMRLGERLIAAAAAECLEAGLSFLKLETTDANAGARRFYERLGFRPVRSETVFALEREAVEALGRRGHGENR